MTDQLKTLIQNSPSISLEKKKLYLLALPLMPPSASQALSDLFRREQETTQKIEHQKQQAILVENETCMRELDTIIKTNLKIQTNSQEAEEKSQSENILKKLDDIKLDDV